MTQFSAVKQFFFPMVSQIGINYRDSSLSKHQGDRDFEVKAGDRMPYFLADGANIYDKLLAPKFHLLVFSDEERGDADLEQQIENEYADSIDFIVMPLYPRVVEIFSTNRSFMVLLRPDNYIGFISTEISLAALKDYILGLS